MFLWIELLAFGFAWIVDAKDSDIFPFKNCSISAFTYQYIYNSQGVSAIIKNIGRSELQDVTCENARCTWDKNSNTLAGLQECGYYNIEASFKEGELQEQFSICVPPEATAKWKLEEAQINETSVTLSWNNHGYERCDLTYEFACRSDGNSFEASRYSSFGKENSCTMTGLSPNTNYSCSSEILFNGKIVKNDSKQITTDHGKPTPVRELQVDPLNQEISAVMITCREPEQINGPQKEYHLYFLYEETAIETKETCYFKVTDLCHLTTYQFKAAFLKSSLSHKEVLFYNGKYFSDPVISNPVETRYVIHYYGNLVTCFAFLIIGKSLAFLLLLHKIHKLIQKKTRDRDVLMQLLNRDYENCGPLIRAVDVAEQTEPPTGSQMCTSVTSPDKCIGHREENELNRGLD